MKEQPEVTPIWDDILDATDREVIRQGGYGQPRGLGRRPVLVIIDAQYNYCGEDKPILEQIARWPSGAGEAAWRAAEKIERLLECARLRRIPVIFTKHVQQHIGFDGFAQKTRRKAEPYLKGANGTQIVETLTPRDEELVVEKSYASAFYGTPLLSYLIKLSADTLIVTGGTTSGCVRSFCVDAISRNFNVGVVQEAVFDRIRCSHKAALLDLWMKYCDVLSFSEALDYLNASQPIPS